jgi:hypothetical protein
MELSVWQELDQQCPTPLCSYCYRYTLAVSGVCVRKGCTLMVFDLVSAIQQHKGKPQQANPAELLASDPATLKVGTSRAETIRLQVLALQCPCLIARVLPVPCRLGYRVW